MSPWGLPFADVTGALSEPHCVAGKQEATLSSSIVPFKPILSDPPSPLDQVPLLRDLHPDTE